MSEKPFYCHINGNGVISEGLTRTSPFNAGAGFVGFGYSIEEAHADAMKQLEARVNAQRNMTPLEWSRWMFYQDATGTGE